MFNPTSPLGDRWFRGAFYLQPSPPLPLLLSKEGFTPPQPLPWTQTSEGQPPSTPHKNQHGYAENPVFFQVGCLSGVGRSKCLALSKKPDQGEGTKVRSTPCASKSGLASLMRMLPRGKARRFGQQTVGHSKRRFGEPLLEHIKAKKALKTPVHGEGTKVRLLFCPLQGRCQTALGTRSRL